MRSRQPRRRRRQERRAERRPGRRRHRHHAHRQQVTRPRGRPRGRVGHRCDRREQHDDHSDDALRMPPVWSSLGTNQHGAERTITAALRTWTSAEGSVTRFGPHRRRTGHDDHGHHFAAGATVNDRRHRGDGCHGGHSTTLTRAHSTAHEAGAVDVTVTTVRATASAARRTITGSAYLRARGDGHGAFRHARRGPAAGGDDP